MKYHLTYVTIAFDLYKNKITGQMNAWKRQGINSSLLMVEKSFKGFELVYVNNPIDNQEFNKTILSKSSSRYRIIRHLFEYLEKEANSENEILYIRRLGINVVFAKRFFKKTNAKVLYEIPTYPIDSGINLLRKQVLKIEEIYFKKYVYPYVVAVPACIQKRIQQLPSKIISINNSVEVSDTDVSPNNASEFTFMFYGNLQPWHGLDSFLNLIDSYNGENKIRARVYSSCTPCYKELLEKYRKCNRIEFCGSVDPKELERKITNKTIGVGGLAYAERGADFDTSLKNKDYAAIGIPFIYVLPDLSFLNYKYAYRVNDVDSLLIDDIIDWYIKIYDLNTNKIIKDYARKNLSYDKQIEELYRITIK